MERHLRWRCAAGNYPRSPGVGGFVEIAPLFTIDDTG